MIAAAASTAAAGEASAPAAEAAHGQGFDAGHYILHHILDSKTIEIPWSGRQIELPTIHLGSLDLSITRNVVMMWIASAILLVLFSLAARRAKDPVPRGLRNVLETLVLWVRDDIARKNIGHGADRYLPFLLTLFFFVLACNLLGLVPGMATATSAIGVTASLAAMTLFMIQWAGIREYGVVKHFKNLIPHGIPVLLLPVMIVVELLGVLSRPFALAIRLFANMTAGHVIILSLIGLIFILQTPWVGLAAVPFSLFIFLLELLVAFIQAYIFTMLASLFIGMSAHPAH
ncbi:MAG TPA: F0F1 ATP synthase subunit A [Candidatus Polarisedimenticolaceae bacterium]|nr:F0F1 ATP synthase subunit A [Candidatus Polarisedimenticolaceae bacterium]